MRDQHRDDFYDQGYKVYVSYACAPRLAVMVPFKGDAGRPLRFETVPDLKKAVARKIRDFVENGGVLFAMCTPTETIDFALAAEGGGNAPPLADGTPPDPPAGKKLRWARAPAFTRAPAWPNPHTAGFSR